MAFVPPQPRYLPQRDRTKSEAFTSRKFTLEDDTSVFEPGHSYYSAGAKNTPTRTLPSWFETGFDELDSEQDALPQLHEQAKVQAALASRYDCELNDISQWNSKPVIGTSRKTASQVMVTKVMKDSSSESHARREITILTLVSDQSLTNLCEWFEVQDALWTIKSYRPSQTVGQVVRENGSFTDDMTKQALNQLFSGIAALFVVGFAHLRICPESVCLDINQQILITDFHYTCCYGKEKMGDLYAPTQEKYGSDIYVAPEVFANKTYNARKATIWGCGVLIYFMITGQTEKLSNLGHPSFDNFTPESIHTNTDAASPLPFEQQLPEQQAQETNHRRKISTSIAQAKPKIIHYPDRFSAPNYARSIIPRMLDLNPLKRAELIEVATRVPKVYNIQHSTRPLMEIAWLDYKSHVGPYAGMNVGADRPETSGFGGFRNALESSASSIRSVASNWSDPFASLLGKGHRRRQSAPVASRAAR